MKLRPVTAAALVAILHVVIQLRFWQQDACLDAGGIWTASGCNGARTAVSFAPSLYLFIGVSSVAVAAALVGGGMLLIRLVRKNPAG